VSISLPKIGKLVLLLLVCPRFFDESFEFFGCYKPQAGCSISAIISLEVNTESSEGMGGGQFSPAAFLQQAERRVRPDAEDHMEIPMSQTDQDFDSRIAPSHDPEALEVDQDF